ncbi:hypothetical protein PAT3040_05125 [Paenibacillus agaridevorans]|uniref:Winged helix DNA-binding domain-containing protein n=1 Tax=Paenibacillus agaridevorans TaxID=171404 RepID=A0A2R5F3A9_9BACL|nr:hypothetical protein [Paenibacillus agaridevorans]GBG10394.1 hypothetical protein PAT3040_05125 [Paenibacillus agaridevorans]
MKITEYEEFVQLVKKYKIFPFAELAPEHPALTVVTEDSAWHTEQATDPWLWRIRIAQEGVAAYGRFFGTKASFIDSALYPAVRTILTGNQSVRDLFEAGSMSRAAHRIYGILSEQGNTDSRQLRKEAGLDAKEDKKEYDKALNELQSGGYIVITGSAKQKESWSSMCYQTSDSWIRSVLGDVRQLSVEEAKAEVGQAIGPVCSEKAFAYFAKKLGLATR